MNESIQTGAQAPPDDDASASPSLNETATNNTNATTNQKDTNTMNTTNTTTLVEGATVTGVVASKNQHGASLDIAGTIAFLPVTQMGETSIGDLAKGTELAVTVVDLTGSKPRVAIAGDVVETTSAVVENAVVESDTHSTVVEPATADETVVTDESPIDEDELSTSIAKLAASWGASVKVDTGKRNPSSKPSKPKARQVVETAVVVAPVTVKVEEPAPVVVEKVETVVEPKSPKSAFLDTVKVGDEVKATVKFKTEFGAHLTVGKLGFGLLHVSEMPGAKAEDRKAFRDGLRYKQELTVRVIKIDTVAGRLGFSLIADEKAEFFANLKVGAVVEGTVSGSKEIGAFINLGKTVGFLHVSEVDGRTREVRDSKLSEFKRGDSLKLVVVAVDSQKQEVRLSQRRLQLAEVVAGAEVSGTFVHVRNNVVVVDLDCGARGFLPKKAGGKRYENGETITATVKSVNVGQGTVELV